MQEFGRDGDGLHCNEHGLIYCGQVLVCKSVVEFVSDALDGSDDNSAPPFNADDAANKLTDAVNGNLVFHDKCATYVRNIPFTKH